MTLEAVKDAIYDAAALYFPGAIILWSSESNTKPKPPYITLGFGSIRRTAFPIEEEDEERGRSYPCRAIMEINLYTKGKPAGNGEKETGSYINTALSDLSGFSNFMDSEKITDSLMDKGIAVLLIPPVRDLSTLENETSYRYRAMAEYEVSFSMEADGAYGIGGMDVPNSSGGGTEELAKTPIEPIKNVEIMTGGMEDEE
jgi:hypothetical protein